MSPEDAEMCAREDAHGIIADANFAVMDLAPGERRIIADGSQYAPSWRVLDGGSNVWNAAGWDTNLALVEAYEEELDRHIDGWSAPNGAYLTWDEGCLFVQVSEEANA